jgi:hypothetical protein
MTREYSNIFNSAIKEARPFENDVTGIFLDNWLGEETIVTYGSGEKNRYLEIHIEAPDFLPSTSIKIELKNSCGVCQDWKIQRGKKLAIRHNLPEHEGTVVLLIKSTFRPSDYQINEDNRRLGLVCNGVWLVSPSLGKEDLIRRL